MRHFGDTYFLKINMKWQIILHIFLKFYTKKSIIFMKFKGKNSYVHMNFPGFAKKVVYCTTYNFLKILALNLGAIFVENIFLQISNCIFFSALFHEKIILKEQITLETKCCTCMCT